METIQQSLDQWKSQGMSFVLGDYQKIKLWGPTELLIKIAPEIQEKKSELIHYLSSQYDEEYRERASIMRWDGRVPQEFADACSHVMVYPRPISIPPFLWEQIQLNAQHLVGNDFWVQEAQKEGWEPRHFFRCHKRDPLKYPKLQGIVFLTYGMSCTGVDYHVFQCRNIKMEENFFKKAYSQDPQETTLMELQKKPFQAQVGRTSKLLH